jgi:hypothetical protein
MIPTLIIAAIMMAAPTTAETDAMFATAGGIKRGKAWSLCRDDANAKLRIDLIRDLNGDGIKDVIVVEDSAICYGAARTSFVLLAGQPKGKWRKMFGSTGVAEVLDQRRGANNWPDISVGGPGFCFPVLRWNGRTYANNRREYLGKPCR